MKAKRIAILGSTGSIGRQALEVIDSQPDLSVCALAAGTNWQNLASQARQFGPEMVAIDDPDAHTALREQLPADMGVLAGPEAMTDLVARTQPDLLLVAVVGSVGIEPTLAGIDCGATLAIANKETLVAAGAVVMPAAGAAGVPILPVDSEHSAVFQCLQAGRPEDVRKITLTASGGALRDWPDDRVADATVEDALKHPTWSMGMKVTIDSATLMNKALEVIEAHWLFGLPAEQIDVLVHPESIVHAMVEYHDGSVIAQLGPPDMTTPIAYALNWPGRPCRQTSALDLAGLGRLTFRGLEGRFAESVALAGEVIRRGGTAGAVLNAANEAAVEAFLDGRIRFGQIVPAVADVLAEADTDHPPDLAALKAADRAARRAVCERIESLRPAH